MCTVTYLPLKNGAIITSSRDEKSSRKKAVAPECYQTKGIKLYYPVDAKAGGTWFIANDYRTVGVLLNGAYKPHQKKFYYIKSRGKILTDIFETHDPLSVLKDYNLSGIENFTIILYDGVLLHKCVWDGIELVIKKINAGKPHIWSSVTLYSTKMICERNEWFEEWLLQQEKFSQKNILHFHSTAGNGNKEFGLLMNRENKMQTVSITSVEINSGNGRLIYRDCVNQSENILQFPFHAVKEKILEY